MLRCDPNAFPALLHERIGPREAVGIALALVVVVALGWEKPTVCGGV